MRFLRELVLLAVLNIQLSTGDNISNDKFAKQSTTYDHEASRALRGTNSMTYSGSPSWWMVDLQGFYTIHNIAITAWTSTSNDISGAVVEVTDKDISLCPGARVTWCGTIPYAKAGEKFTFNCDQEFPVRFVRISKDSYLRLGHVEVQGIGTDKMNKAYYTKTQNKKVTRILQTVGAVKAGECGIFCHQRHDCLHFSYSKTAPSDANCLLTNYPVPEYTTAETGWVLHTLDDCK